MAGPGIADALHLAAGIGTLWQLSRWQSGSVRSDVLLGILHLEYLIAGCGFPAAAGHSAFPNTVPPLWLMPVWAIGSIGVMTLAMMTRATLGHTGGTTTTDRATTSAYLRPLLA